ncbi:MAG: hypothetical protein EZS28_027353 [Streblomastix strix]|uniref:Uncharacterized protein n=1 Tax=Streblomastix strix TaxID=222440 RepID=A0A5J4V326_9EUKA|nr:MAG: hypothetical protein EZS28_027353 [Streblomastix strix]
MIRLFKHELGRLQYAIDDANKKVTGIKIFYNSSTFIKWRIIRSSYIQVLCRDIKQHKATIDMHRRAVTARATSGEYITQQVYPVRIDGLLVHRDSTVHSDSIVNEKERLDSMITKDNEKVDIKRKNAATKMVKIVHWTAIQEFSQSKIPDLIRVIDIISENKQLSEFGHFLQSHCMDL